MAHVESFTDAAAVIDGDKSWPFAVQQLARCDVLTGEPCAVLQVRDDLPQAPRWAIGSEFRIEPVGRNLPDIEIGGDVVLQQLLYLISASAEGR